MYLARENEDWVQVAGRGGEAATGRHTERMNKRRGGAHEVGEGQGRQKTKKSLRKADG